MPFMQLKTNVAVTEQQETLLKTSFGSAIMFKNGQKKVPCLRNKVLFCMHRK